MVQLVEIEDEHFQIPQQVPDDDDDYSDTDSEISNDSDYATPAETLTDRLFALRDMIPGPTRAWLSGKAAATTRVVKTGLVFMGRSAWTLSVSALLVGIPFALCYAEEQNVIAMEQEARMREVGGELLTGEKAGEGDTANQLGAALGAGPVAAKAAL